MFTGGQRKGILGTNGLKSSSRDLLQKKKGVVKCLENSHGNNLGSVPF